MKRIAPLSVLGCLCLLFAASACFAQMAGHVDPVHFYLPFGIAIDKHDNILVSSFIDDPDHLGLAGIFEIDGATGATRVITTGLDTPCCLAVASDGSIFVNDYGARWAGGVNRITRIDPLTGSQTIIVNGGIFPVAAGQLGGLLVAPDGSILTIDVLPSNPVNLGRIVRTDPSSGNQSVVFSIPDVGFGGLALESDGHLLVTASAPRGGVRAILRVDLNTAASSVLSSDGNLGAAGLAINSAGVPYVVSPFFPWGLNKVVAVDPVSGTQSVISSGGLLTAPMRIVFDSRGNLFVDDLFATGEPPVVNVSGNGAIFGIEPSSGLQTIVALGSRTLPALVQPPINAEGSSIFTAKGVVPVKFALTQNGVPTCTLPPATISVTRTAGGTVGPVPASIYSTPADNGSNFTIAGCQYIYKLAASSLGVGTYRVDISINGIFVGHAVFALQ